MNQHVAATESVNRGRRSASRRQFLGAGAAASVASGLMVHSAVAAAEEPRELRLGIVGCGGRGSGAANDSLTINDNVKLVAAADLYPAKCAALRKNLASHGDKVAFDDAKMYGGLDGYRRILDDSEVDIVLLTTSPGQSQPQVYATGSERRRRVLAV